MLKFCQIRSYQDALILKNILLMCEILNCHFNTLLFWFQQLKFGVDPGVVCDHVGQ